jgi:type I restriction enzyme S subunit
MKLETFFEKFDQFADAPDAVGKIHELVLHLAVHGNLVSQSADDEAATALLARSRAEMAKRMAARQAKQEKPAAPVSDDEATFLIPAGWAWCRLVDAGQFINGLAFKPSDWGNIGRPIIRIQNLSGRNPDYNRTTGTFDSSVLVQDGDILVSWSATLDAFIWRGEEAVLNQHIFRVLPAPLADRGYLFWLLKWVIRQLAESDHAHGLVMSHINRGPFLARPIPLPPLAEQKRIVAKVDELMTLCDRLEAQQQERETRHAALARASLTRFADAPTPASLQFLFHKSYTIPPADLRKSILTLAVQGKLVPQDPNDAPASEILASGAKLPEGHIRRRKIMKRAPIASKAEMFPDLPPSWEYADVQTLYDLNLIVDYADGNHGSLYPRSSEFGDSGVTFVTARDIANGRVSWDGCALLNKGRAHQLTKGWARGGDVLLTHNATVGRVARVEREIGKFLLGTSATFYRLNEEFIDPSYFYHVLCSPTWQGQLEAIMEQTTRNQVSIQKQAFFRVPIPPLAEQRRIVAKVDQLMILVDQLETQLTASYAAATNLLEALVAEISDKANAVSYLDAA